MIKVDCKYTNYGRLKIKQESNIEAKDNDECVMVPIGRKSDGSYCVATQTVISMPKN